MKSKITIAIDGYSSCGKSTLAKALAKALDYVFVDSGAMYRAVTLFCLNHQIDIENKDAVTAILPSIKIHFENRNGQNRTFLNGIDVENDIRQMYVSEKVSIVSIISSVRRAMVKQQQEMGKNKGIVMDGRDIGTVVFPYAELKIFMTANTQIRTERRLAELKTKGIVNMDFETVQKNLLERDHIDSTRLDSPLCKAEDAIVIDNSALTETQQLEIALHLAKDRIYKIMAEEGVDR